MRNSFLEDHSVSPRTGLCSNAPRRSSLVVRGAIVGGVLATHSEPLHSGSCGKSVARIKGRLAWTAGLEFDEAVFRNRKKVGGSMEKLTFWLESGVFLGVRVLSPTRQG